MPRPYLDRVNPGSDLSVREQSEAYSGDFRNAGDDGLVAAEGAGDDFEQWGQVPIAAWLIVGLLVVGSGLWLERARRNRRLRSWEEPELPE
ncbi:MAG: hypothetical protein PVJ28_11485 [Acidimicrobiia bacterium]